MQGGRLIKELERSGLTNQTGEKIGEDLQPDTHFVPPVAKDAACHFRKDT